MSATRDFRLGRPLDRARIERALALEDPDRPMLMPMRPTRLAGIAAYYSDDFAGAAALYRDLRRHAIDRGEDSHLPMVDADLSMAERIRGNLAQAVEFADEGCEIAQMLGSDTARADMLCERSYVRAALGDESGSRTDLELALACNTDDEYAATWLAARARSSNYRWATHGPPATHSRRCARASRQRVRAISSPPWSFQTRSRRSSRWASSTARRVSPRRSNATAATHEQSSVLASVARCRALLAAAGGDLERASAEIELALHHQRRIEMPLELGRTLLVAGQIERRSKRKRAAREALREALEIFDAIGAQLWAQRARIELERTGVRHTDGDELTPTELRVAELAADGLTNRRIAETLFVSAKTVEANLARVYLKLGIRSRAQLGAAMAQRKATGSVI